MHKKPRIERSGLNDQRDKFPSAKDTVGARAASRPLKNRRYLAFPNLQSFTCKRISRSAADTPKNRHTGDGQTSDIILTPEYSFDRFTEKKQAPYAR
jgi:hypothetical protein